MPEKMRIDKLLSNMGLGTRSEIKRAVKQGKVTLNGTVVKDSGLIIDPIAQEVAYEGERVIYRNVIYLMLNKPQGVISATEDNKDRTVIDLLKQEDTLLNPFPVGRLDKDTVGLLLLTNDGQLAHELLSPRKHVDKTYEALVWGDVGEVEQTAFTAGVELDDGYVTMPAELMIVNKEEQPIGICSTIRLTIREGKFHQVKRMFDAVGKKVLTLKRISMGPLQLDESLEEGSYRELTAVEVEQLRAHRGREK
ncbi:rRNA pseudouridine synthase [Paenibacillus sp. GSMTC-2017]|uniref:pseudouridine synthase n=1 Tax=Paenibacillus sp. GSMTC-2017 TaxID=2794350 RepID=UPI0018D833FB|nr:pseudouridine synthase [Paenibacillus sp. GSMTC-2017]MBH5318182.1 rRNA pseudouridine synthase [Paenibacillus sp. GSMTC-2017]